MRGFSSRVRQFLQAFTGSMTSQDWSFLDAYLTPNLLRVFSAMSPRDQAHCVRVTRRLYDQGSRDPDLIAAALLHDAGKSLRPLSLFERVLIVLANPLRPSPDGRKPTKPSPGLRGAFETGDHHPEWGARLIHAAGGGERVVSLVRNHQSKDIDRDGLEFSGQLADLQAADKEG